MLRLADSWAIIGTGRSSEQAASGAQVLEPHTMQRSWLLEQGGHNAISA